MLVYNILKISRNLENSLSKFDFLSLIGERDEEEYKVEKKYKVWN